MQHFRGHLCSPMNHVRHTRQSAGSRAQPRNFSGTAGIFAPWRAKGEALVSWPSPASSWRSARPAPQSHQGHGKSQDSSYHSDLSWAPAGTAGLGSLPFPVYMTQSLQSPPRPKGAEGQDLGPHLLV